MRTLTKVATVATLAVASVFGASAANAADIPNPQGVLLDTVTATITATPGTLDLNNSASWVSDGTLAGNASCGLDVTGADRVYQSLNIKIVKAGHYTFRIVGTDPVFAGDDTASPIQDPYLALYSGFDTANLDNGVVGCNDDEWDTLANPWANGDTFISNGESNTNDRWSVFEADLEPGDYTAVLTTWGPVTLASWAANAPQSATFEYWGPECGIEGAVCALPDTGANASVIGSSVAISAGLLVAGVLALVMVRRRQTAK